MFLAEVLGTVVSPVQHPVLAGERLLLLRVLAPDGKPVGRTRIALDRARAGVGERVLVIDEGNSGRQLVGRADAPVKTVIVGVVDYVQLDGALVYDARDAGGGEEAAAPMPPAWSEDETRLRGALCRVAALCYQKGYIVGADGNLSARMADGTVLVTPTGAMKGFLEPHHLAHVDLDGRVLDAGPRPSSE